MKKYVIYFIIVFGVTACGSRKTETDISKQSSEVRDKEQTKSEEKQSEQSQFTKSDETKNDTEEKETTKTTTTEFGNDGKPTKQTTTETTKNKTDKSTNTKKETIVVNRTHLKHSVANRDIRQVITIKEKTKKTERVDIYVYLFWGLLGLNILARIILYIRHRIKK